MVLPSDLKPTFWGDVQGTVRLLFLLESDTTAKAARIHSVYFVNTGVFFEVFLRAFSAHAFSFHFKLLEKFQVYNLPEVYL